MCMEEPETLFLEPHSENCKLIFAKLIKSVHLLLSPVQDGDTITVRAMHTVLWYLNLMITLGWKDCFQRHLDPRTHSRYYLSQPF